MSNKIAIEILGVYAEAQGNAAVVSLATVLLVMLVITTLTKRRA